MSSSPSYEYVELLFKNRSSGTLSLLASLTREVIKAREQNGKEEDTWAAEALDTLLDTWTVLLQVSIFLVVIRRLYLINHQMPGSSCIIFLCISVAQIFVES